jgi:hypothetical protein
MAIIDDIQNSERLLDLSNKIIDAVNERRKLLKKIDADEQLHLFTIKQQQKLSQDIAANAEKYLGYQIKSKDLDKQIKASKDNIAKSIISSTRSINGQLNLEQKLINQRKQSLNDAISLRNKEKEVKKKIEELDIKNSSLEFAKQNQLRAGNLGLARQIQAEIRENQINANIKEKQIKLLQEEGQKQKDIAKSTFKIIKNAKEAREAQARELAFLEKNLIIRKQIERSTGLLGGIAKGLSKIPGIGQYIKADEAIDEMEKLAASMEEKGKKSTSFGNRLEIGLKGASVLAKGLADNLKSPEAVFTFLITQANKADQQTTQLAKSLMQTKFEAMQTREEFVGMANAAEDAFINTDKLIEANASLGKQLGFNKVFSQDMNQTFVDLTKKIGLSEEAAGGLAKVSIATGKTLKSTEQTIAGVTSKISAQNGIQLDGKEILEESGKISGQLLANFKGNPVAIAEAVAQTKVLGTTLEQTKNQASKLLDFESSIGSQLKAELLTGQQLNLERARAAALQGDQVKVAKELTAQGMNFNKFSRLNVIQQNAFAEALGLSSDQLTDQLLKQEAIGKSRSEIVALAGEEAAKRLESLSAQDKFNSAVVKLQDLLGNIVGGPLGTILDILSDTVGLVGKLISGIQSILGNTLMKGVLGAATGFAVGGIPGLVVGGVAGLASGVISNADDMTGYGARTLLTPTGAVALNNNDTVIAGTNLFKGNDVTSYPKGALNLGGSDNSRLEDLMTTLIDVTKSSNNKQFGVNLDGRAVGTGVVRATYRSA